MSVPREAMVALETTLMKDHDDDHEQDGWPLRLSLRCILLCRMQRMLITRRVAAKFR